MMLPALEDHNVPPSHLRLDSRGLSIQWDASDSYISAPDLRTQCRCAHCKQMAKEGRPTQASAELLLLDASPVGSYGVQLHFSDGHARGIYPWSYLRALGEMT